MLPEYENRNPFWVDIFNLAKEVDDAIHRHPSDAELHVLLRNTAGSLLAYVELRSVMMSTRRGRKQVRKAERDIEEYMKAFTLNPNREER